MEIGNAKWHGTYRPRYKQDVIIVDQSSKAKVSLWEEHVNAMEEHKSHYLKNFID